MHEICETFSPFVSALKELIQNLEIKNKYDPTQNQLPF